MRRITILLGVFILATLAVAGNAPALGTPSSATKFRPVNVARLTAPPAACPGQDDPDAAVHAQETAMRCMIDYARIRAGAAVLREAGTLDTAARNKAGDILRCDQFSHSACGRDFLFWFRALDYVPSNCWRVGENIAWADGNLASVRSVMQAWLRSPPHRGNLLNDSYDQFGLGLRVGALSGIPRAHVWVNHFGTHC